MKIGNIRLSWTTVALTMVLFLMMITLKASMVLPKFVVIKPPVIKLGSSTTIQIPPLVRCSLICKIMPLGDSITYGHGSTDNGGYRFSLWNDLEARGAHIQFVGSMQSGPAGFPRYNQGLPGWKIDQLAAHVVSWLKRYQPQIILLHIGTNDFGKGDDPANAPARLKSLIDQITATVPNATLIVAQIIPLLFRPQMNTEVINYNRAIPAIVQAEVVQGKHVAYVDMYHAVSPALIPDRIHPDDRGYEEMAKVWEEALISLLRLNPINMHKM